MIGTALDGQAEESFNDAEFDEYAEDAIPPDLPSRSEAVRIVRDAAAKDPAFRHFVDQWLPRHDLGNFSQDDRSGAQLFKQDLSEATVPFHLEQHLPLKQVISDRFVDNQKISALLQQSRYQRMVGAARSNYSNYRFERVKKSLDVFQRMNGSTDMSLHEAQKMFTAAHFDISAKGVVNLERIVEHRDSLRMSMLEMLKRDLANLENDFCAPVPAIQDNRALEEIILGAKAEIIRNVDKARQNKIEIERLQALRTVEATGDQKEHARLAVHWRLLEILDEMVPAMEVGSIERVANHEDSSRRFEDMNDALARLSTSIARYNPSNFEEYLQQQRHKQQSSQTQIRSARLKISRLMESNIASKSQDNQGGVPDAMFMETSNTYRQSFEEIHQLQRTIQIEHEKCRESELHKVEAVSDELLKDTFTKSCLESPLLAQRDLHNERDLLRLAHHWSEACEEKEKERAAMLDHQFVVTSAKLQEIEAILTRTSQIRQDFDMYNTG